ncbi:STAS domain-containing protein [Streptomyces sp. NPDC058326]|uniref:STAS domain-containing protein n=1 Tax=Streptomyces sp. NPDC058326 TaxID=3346447 RepID=UPI0036F17E56
MQDDHRADVHVGTEHVRTEHRRAKPLRRDGVGGERAGTATLGTSAGATGADPAGPLTVEARPGAPAGAVVLLVQGELDYGSAAPLRDALEEHDRARRVVVDCAGLRFCDSTGLNLLLKARLRMLDAGGRLDLAGLRASVDRMFEITGARQVFRVYGDADEALRDAV